MEILMARPINYLFCNYEFEIDDEILDETAEFNLISENQGGEFCHGREKNGFQPQILCTDPVRRDLDEETAHSFEIGYKPGIRTLQEYDSTSRKKISRIEQDNHTKFGHVVTIPSLRAMAIRDSSSEDTIGAHQTIGRLKSLVRGFSGGNGQINLTYANEEDVAHALQTWDINEYSYTARPLNPTGGALAKLRTEMYRVENVYQENGKVKAAPGESLRVANGTLGQTQELYEGGFAQVGFKGETEDGHFASIPKLNFYQDKVKNLRVREARSRYIRVSFNRDDEADDKTLDVAQALLRFYTR